MQAEIQKRIVNNSFSAPKEQFVSVYELHSGPSLKKYLKVLDLIVEVN